MKLSVVDAASLDDAEPRHRVLPRRRCSQSVADLPRFQALSKREDGHAFAKVSRSILQPGRDLVVGCAAGPQGSNACDQLLEVRLGSHSPGSTRRDAFPPFWRL